MAATLGIIAVIAIVIFYLWWRVRDIKANVDTVIGAARDMQDRVKSAPVATNATSLTGANTPGADVAVLLYSLVTLKRQVRTDDEPAIAAMLESGWGMSAAERNAAATFAAWAAANVGKADKIIAGYLPTWKKLDASRRQTLIDLATQAAALGGPPNAPQSAALRKLSDGLAR